MSWLSQEAGWRGTPPGGHLLHVRRTSCRGGFSNKYKGISGVPGQGLIYDEAVEEVKEGVRTFKNTYLV